jgi:hypothetical protein
MNFKEIVLPVLLLVLAVVAIAATLTVVTMFHDAAECASNGGTSSVEGFTQWCRY